MKASSSLWFYRIAMAAIILSTVFIILLAYWAIFPYKILKFNEGNGTFITPTVQAGEYLQMRQHSCKYMDLPSHIDRQFIDGIIYQVPNSINRRPLGCSERIEYVYIPKALPPGVYSLHTTITYHPNPIRTITYTVTTGKFTVTK